MQSAVVTGAGSGIGRACALRLAVDGYGVTVNDLNSEAAQAVAVEIKASGGSAIAAAGDVSREAAAAVAFLCSDQASLFVGQTIGPNSGDVML